jgi:hypothetical protein
MLDLAVGLKQDRMLRKSGGLEMGFETLKIGLGDLRQQKVLHHALPGDRRERRELSAIGALAE